MMHAVALEKKLDILKTGKPLDLSLNDIRIIVGCFRAVAYQEELDGEQYLDADALALKARLESVYRTSLNEDGENTNSP